MLNDFTDTPELTRTDCLADLARLSSSEIVLDNSDRISYREAPQILAGWHEDRYIGFRSHPFTCTCTETTVFSRQ